VFDEIDEVMAERNSWFGLAPTIVTLSSQGPQSADTPNGVSVQPSPFQGTTTPDEVVTDQDVDDFIATFTRYTRTRALLNREQWMRVDGATSLPRHAQLLVQESMLGYYPAEHAVRALVAACSPHGVAPKSLLKTALAAILTPKVCA
jgi:hypothetical protein